MHPYDSDPALRRLLTEYQLVRNHNHKVGDTAPNALVLAEGGLAVTLLERLLRVLLGKEATDSDTLDSLLDKATSARVDAIDSPLRFAYMPHKDGATPARTNERNRDISTEVIRRVRNPLVHGNYEQLAAGRASIEEYFTRGLRGDLDQTFHFIAAIWLQFDRSGQRIDAGERSRIREENELRAAKARFVRTLAIRAARAARK